MFIQDLTSLRLGNTNEAGGKAASLGELIAAKVPVPAGFVLLARLFDDFLAQNRLTKPTAAAIIATPLSPKLQTQIEEAYQKLNSPFVAVRSSATAEDGLTHAWAGQLESFVPTSEADLVTNIKKCWASLYSPRALAYRAQAGLADTPVSVGVIVQQLIDSQFAGIGFSQHPVTGNPNHIVIETVQGLGEAAVGGHVTPDTFIIDKTNGSVIDFYNGTQTRQLVRTATGLADWQEIPQPKHLDESHVNKLTDLITTIESHFGRPMDIEWALAHDTVYIVQSRPITT